MAIGRGSGVLGDQAICDRDDLLAVTELEKDLRGAALLTLDIGTDGGKSKLGVCRLSPLMRSEKRLAKCEDGRLIARFAGKSRET